MPPQRGRTPLLLPMVGDHNTVGCRPCGEFLPLSMGWTCPCQAGNRFSVYCHPVLFDTVMPWWVSLQSVGSWWALLPPLASGCHLASLWIPYHAVWCSCAALRD